MSLSDWCYQKRSWRYQFTGEVCQKCGKGIIQHDVRFGVGRRKLKELCLSCGHRWHHWTKVEEVATE